MKFKKKIVRGLYRCFNLRWWSESLLILIEIFLKLIVDIMVKQTVVYHNINKEILSNTTYLKIIKCNGWQLAKKIGRFRIFPLKMRCRFEFLVIDKKKADLQTSETILDHKNRLRILSSDFWLLKIFSILIVSLPLEIFIKYHPPPLIF